MLSRENHALADVFFHHFAWFEVGNDLHFKPNQLFWIWIEVCDTREDLAVFTGSCVQAELEELVRTFDFLAVDDLCHTDFCLVKVLKLDLCFVFILFLERVYQRPFAL